MVYHVFLLDISSLNAEKENKNKFHFLPFREAAKKKPFLLGNLSQMWVCGVAVSQTRSKPLKTPPNHPENCLF